MTFHVGQRVVCVDDVPRSGMWAPNMVPPIIGEIYTVSRANFPSPFVRNADIISIKELPNTYGGYLACRFRPIVSRKTSIEIFTKMLTPKRVDA